MAEQNGMHAALPTGTGYAGLAEDLDLTQLLIERGTSGLRRSAGFVREELLPALSGPQGMRVYRQMRDTDAVLGACLFAIEMLMRNVTWRFEAADDSVAALEAADFAESVFFRDLDQSWSMLLAEILTMLTFGWAFFDITLKRRTGWMPPQQLEGIPYMPSRYEDGQLGFGKIGIRAQETLLRWEFDPKGGVMGMHQMDPFTGTVAYLPMEKALLFRPTSWKNNPEGRSLLRNAYSSWYNKLHVERMEAIGIERDLTGLPVFYVPAQWTSGTATPDMVAQLEYTKRMARNLRNDEQAGLVLPSIYDGANQIFKFELAASQGHRAFDTDKIVQRYDLRMAQSVLCDVIFLGHEAVGSFALASNKTHLLSMALGGYLMSLTEVINDNAIPLLWRVNKKPRALMPRLGHGDVESVDLKELGQFIKDYSQSGLDILDLENDIRTQAGFRERTAMTLPDIPPGSEAAPGAEDDTGEGVPVQKRRVVRRPWSPRPRLVQGRQLALAL